MSQIIARLYATSAAAERAAASLPAQNVPARDIHVMSADSPGGIETAAAERTALINRIARLGVARDEARRLAPEVERGATLVVAAAPFGHAIGVIRALEAEGPIPTARSANEYYRADEDLAAPLSELAGLPVLGGRGDWLSSLFGLPTLTGGQPTGSGLLIQEGREGYKPVLGSPLSGGSSPYRPTIPGPLLSGGPAGTSNRGFLGLPLLSGGRATGSNTGFLGLPLLIRD